MLTKSGSCDKERRNLSRNWKIILRYPIRKWVIKYVQVREDIKSKSYKKLTIKFWTLKWLNAASGSYFFATVNMCFQKNMFAIHETTSSPNSLLVRPYCKKAVEWGQLNKVQSFPTKLGLGKKALKATKEKLNYAAQRTNKVDDRREWISWTRLING